MKRLIVCGALLFGGFSGLLSGCGSRSSDDLYLPEVSAGEAPFSRGGGSGTNFGTAGRDNSAGDSGLAGDDTGRSGGSSGGAFSSAGAGAGAGAGGSIASSGSSGFVSIGGSVGIAGSSGFAQGGTAVGGWSGGFADAGAPSEGGSAGDPTAGSGGASIAGSGGIGVGGVAGATPAGGSSGVSGSSGAGTAGAGGGNSLSCPLVTPQNNVMCSDTSLTCSYVGERCRCRQIGNNTVWRCTGSGDACPSIHPVAAASCTGNLQCPYPAGDQCNCLNGKWNCFSPGCPASKPTPGGSCGAVAGQCSYGTAGGCLCSGGSWFCN